MRKPWVAVAAIVIVSLLPTLVQMNTFYRAGLAFGDFSAFYCAAKVATSGANPYRTEPLRTCEANTLGLHRFTQRNPGVAVPAPIPGYVVALLVPFSLLPFDAAAIVWTLLLYAAWAACIYAIARFSGMRWQIVIAALAISLGVTSIPLGQVVPLSLAAICISAMFASAQRWNLAAIAAAASMIEPHLGLPACIALAIFAPSTRIALALAGALLAAVSLVMLGPAANVEYLASVLPAQALAEAAHDMQYSLTTVLTSFGLTDTLAVRIGSLWYFASLLVGVIVAGVLARKTKNAAFLACVPPAFAVFGGAYIHVTQIAAAIPAVLLLIPYLEGLRRNVAIAALLLLAVPWIWVLFPANDFVVAFPVAYLAWTLWGGDVQITTVVALVAGALDIGLLHAYAVTPAHLPGYAGTHIDPRLPESAWSVFSSTYSATNTLAVWATRIPTWAGLMLLLATAMALAVERVGVSGFAQRSPATTAITAK